MRKKSLALTLMLAFSCIFGGNLMGQSSVCTYGDDATLYSANYSPYGGYDNYEYYVYLYDATNVNFDGIINNVSFKCYEAAEASNSIYYTIYMKDVPSETTLSSSTTFASFTDGATLVSERTTTPALTSGWNTTALTTSFEHADGNSLLVMVKAEGKTLSHKVYYKSVSNHIWYKRGSGSTDPGTNVTGGLLGYLPSIKLTYSPVACPKPKALNATSITKNSATLGWTSDAESFNIQYKATNADSWTTVEDINTNSYTLDGNLSPKTTYQFKVQAVCSGTPGSYSNPVSFTTSCELSYTMGFESSEISEFNALWTVISNSTSQNSSAKRTGDYGLKIGNSSTTSQYIVTPQIDATGGSLSFYYKGYSYTPMTFKVGCSNTTNDVNTAFTWDMESTTVNSDWSEYTKIIPAGTKYIAILINSSSYSYTYIDDITINAPSAISRPTSLSVSNVTYNSAQFNWTAGGSETSWKLQYKKTGDGGWTTVDVSSKPHTISTLDENSTYQWQVAAYIAPNTSDYEPGDNFTTPAQYPAPTGLTTSNLMTSGATFTWDYTEDATEYNLRYSVSSPIDWTTVSGLTEETYTIGSGLTGNTAYKVQVQAIYGENASAWAEYSFTTLPIKRYTTTSSTPTMNHWNHYMAWTPDGVPEINHDVVIEQNAQISSNYTAVANNVTINADVTLTIRTNAVLTCNHITNNGTLVIEDGGQLILPKTSTGIQATVKKETYGATAKDTYYWFAISSAVANPSISSATNITSGTYDLYRFNEAKNADLPWENYKNEAYSETFTTLEKGRGYLYRNTEDLSIAMTGEINVADFNYSVTNSGGALAGFNLIGNPYSHDIYKGAGTAIPNGDDFLRTGFYYMDPTTGKWTTGTDNSTAIKPNEAIFVQTDKDGSITMTNTNASSSAKANNDNIMFKVANSQYSDEAYAWFDKGRGLNKISHRNAEVPMLYINQDGENYAIATMSDDTKTFSLNLKAMTTGKYTLSYKTKGEFSYLHVIDRFTGEDVDMLLEGEYSFVASPSDSDARFIVRLEYTSNYGDTDSSVFAYQSGNDIIVSGEGELQIFDVMGRKISTHQINGVETVNVNAHGVYIFKLNEKTQKIIIK